MAYGLAVVFATTIILSNVSQQSQLICNVNVKCIVEMLNDTYNTHKSEHICGLEKR